MSIDPQNLKQFVESEFTQKALPDLQKFISIPNQSPAYDPDWQKNKTLLTAASQLRQYAEMVSGVQGLSAILSSDEDKTPFLLITIEATASDNKTIMFYGHYDKQPPLEGWGDGLGPYTPVVRDGYLYGRGAADDGYSTYAALTMIRSLQYFKVPHPKFVIIVEGSEESGSIDLPFYLDEYQQFIGAPDLIISMDSGTLDYDRIWLTSSLRGLVSFDLNVDTLTKGIHSGKGSGVAPESFMILRKLISRIENYNDKSITIKNFEVDISDDVRSTAEKTYALIKDKWLSYFPLLPGVNLLGENSVDLYLSNNWKPSLIVMGESGIPAIKDAGNVLRPYTHTKISIRTPPTYETVKNAKQTILDILTKDPPFNSSVTCTNFEVSDGIVIPKPSDQLSNALNSVCKNYLKNDYAEFYGGFSIPFTAIIGYYFPNSPFIVTGAAGPDSNPHGLNEKLNLSYTKNFICTFTHVLANYKQFV